MTKRSMRNHVNRMLTRLHFKMHKSKKKWIVVGVASLALVGGVASVGKFDPNIDTQLGITQKTDEVHADTNPLKPFTENDKQNATRFKILNSSESHVISPYGYQNGYDTTARYGYEDSNTKLLKRYYHVPLPAHPHGDLNVFYRNAVKYNGEKYDVKVNFRLNKFRRYEPVNNYQKNLKPPYINISKNMKNGIIYSGFRRGAVTLSFFQNGQRKSIPNAFFEFDSLNGLGTNRTGASLNHWNERSDAVTGEWTQYINGGIGYIEKRNHNIGQYYSPSLGKRIDGGLPNLTFPDTNEAHVSRAFLKNSIAFKTDNNKEQNIMFGSGEGSAWWKLSDLALKPGKPTLEKSTTNPTLNNKNEKYTYTINGTIPRNLTHRNDYYHFYDDISNQDKINGTSSSLGNNVKTEGNRVEMNLNKSQLEKDGGKKFSIKVSVNPANPDHYNSRWDYIYNTAHAQTPTDNVESNQTVNKIRHKVHHHYTPPQSTTPVTKTTNQQNITHPGEDYSYTITGQIPKWKYHNTPHYTRDWIPGTPGYSGFNYTLDGHTYYIPGSPGTPGHYGSPYIDYYYNAYPQDHYRLSDNVPDYVSIQSIDTDGMPVTQNGNHVSMNLDSNDMEAYSGQRYRIKIHVKADRLPGLNGSSINDTDGSEVGYSGGIGSGWLNWYNRATADEQVYTKDNDYEQSDMHSHNVRNRIRKIRYHVYQYDFNHNQNGNGNGDNIPESEMPGHDDHSLSYGDNSVPGGDNDDGGDNDQYHGNFTHNSILQEESHIGYEGTHVQVPILTDRYNNYTDENGNEQHGKYKFAYNENTDNVYPVLGGFDNTTKGSKQSGHLIPNSPETSSFEKDGDNDNGTPDPNSSIYGDDSDVGFSMNFYKPYIVPRAKATKFGRFIVDTDKQNAGNKGLPFRLDFKTLNYVHNFNDDFAGDSIHVRVTDPDTGTMLYDNDVPMSDSRFFSPYHHGDGHKGTRLVEFKDRLNTSSIPGLRKGSKVPLHVDVGFDDPSQAQLDGKSTDSHGWIASESNLTGNGNNNETDDHTDEEFNHGSKAKFLEPERTIKYFNQESDDDDPRTQFEQFEVDQDHKQPATLKTGYGLRNDMKIKYSGLIGANDSGDDWANGDTQSGYGYRDQVKNGSTTDFIFPKSWTKQDNDVKYSHNVPYGKDNISDPSGNTNSMFHDFDDSHKESGYHNFAESGHDTYDKADMADRMEHTNEDYNFKDFDENLPDNLDTLSEMVDPTTAKAVDRAYDTYNGGEYNEHLKAGTYSTDYQFYPRASVRGNGDIQLKSGFNDPLASNDPTRDIGSSVISDLNGSNINRMFTPYWLPLGYYNTGFEKAQPSQNVINGKESGDGQTNGMQRLGGNYFNFENNRFDQATAHMYLADQSKSEGLDAQGHGSDELSIQPILSGHKHNGHIEYSQMPFGFTNSDYDWLTGHDINETK